MPSRLVLVTGEAGIGKSRLVREVLAASADAGVLVLAGACLPLADPWPYLPIAEALGRLADPTVRELLHRALARTAPFVAEQLAVLVPELDPDGRVTGDWGGRPRLFAAVRDLLAALTGERPVCLFVEDLHWADRASLDLLTYLTRTEARNPATLVVTSRVEEMPDGHPVLDWLRLARRQESTLELGLGPLDSGEVFELVDALSHGAVGDPALAREVLRRGEGNPFFTEQLVAAALDAAPRLSARDGLPSGVADLLLSRLRSLSRDGRDVVSVLAVAGRALTEPELASCVGSADTAVALRELVGARLAVRDGDGHRLRHVLLEDGARSTLLPSELAALHASVAAVLAGRADRAPAAEVAGHLAAAGDWEAELWWAALAAEEAERLYAYAEAANWWGRVDDHWDCGGVLPDGSSRGDAVVRRVDALWRAGAEAQAAVVLADESRTDRFAADDRSRARLLLRESYMQNRLLVGGNLELIERAEELFARLPPEADTARTLHRKARALDVRGDAAAAEAAFNEATRIAELVGATSDLVGMSLYRSMQALKEGGTEAAIRIVLPALEQARANRFDQPIMSLAVMLTHLRLCEGRYTELVDEGSRFISESAGRGMHFSFEHGLLVTNTATAALMLGRTSDAEALLAGPGPEDPNTGWLWRLMTVSVYLTKGRLDDAAELHKSVTEASMRGRELSSWRTELELELGLWQANPATAVRAAWAQTDEIAHSTEGLGRTLWLLARALADLKSGLEHGTDLPGINELAVVAQKYAAFAPHPERPLAHAYQAFFDGELSRITGTEPDWPTAAGQVEAMGCVHLAGYAWWRHAEALLDRRQRTAAEEALRRAAILSSTHRPQLASIAALAVRAGIDVAQLTVNTESATTPVDDPATPYGLTARELAVLELVGRGRTNRQIAAALYISPKTASVHVSAILRKLAVTNRVQAGAVAQRLARERDESR